MIGNLKRKGPFGEFPASFGEFSIAAMQLWPDWVHMILLL